MCEQTPKAYEYVLTISLSLFLGIKIKNTNRQNSVFKTELLTCHLASSECLSFSGFFVVTIRLSVDVAHISSELLSSFFLGGGGVGGP